MKTQNITSLETPLYHHIKHRLLIIKVFFYRFFSFISDYCLFIIISSQHARKKTSLLTSILRAFHCITPFLSPWRTGGHLKPRAEAAGAPRCWQHNPLRLQLAAPAQSSTWCAAISLCRRLELQQGLGPTCCTAKQLQLPA